MKQQRKILLAAFVFLLVVIAVVVKVDWRPWFSRQETIEPEGLTGEFEPGETVAVFDSRRFWTPPLLAVEREGAPLVLGESGDDKRVEIDLTNQRIYGYEADRQVYNFLISSGKWGRTPTGVFRIWVKLRYTKMEGGSQALRTYYYLPNVPYVMYFYNEKIPKFRGYGVHGTYWHDNFGHPMSHGCINMKTEEVGQLYYWARPDLKGRNSIYATADNLGTVIVIYGEAPWD